MNEKASIGGISSSMIKRDALIGRNDNGNLSYEVMKLLLNLCNPFG